MTLEGIDNHFASIQLIDAVMKARGDKAALIGEQSQKIGVSELRAEFTTFITGGNLITTPDKPDPNNVAYPNQLGFDHMESYLCGYRGKTRF
ncbi:MAG: hypothetical protein U5K54_00020 [Cytophagales bacterium]|nr:hypothetical protein [Cytophagales bacterium]